MKAKLASQIFTECPIIDRQRTLGPESSLMCFGFECDDGWYQLIYDLSVAIEQKARQLKENDVEEALLPSVSQVKEKFGRLHFNVHNIYEAFEELIDEAEEKSFQICELCKTRQVKTLRNGMDEDSVR